jgi:putative transport protein
MTGKITWVTHFSANLTLRQIGLLLFLAGVGTKAGYSFATTFGESGPRMMLAGAAVTMGVTGATMVFGYKIPRIPFDSLLGRMSGVQTQSACLAYASKMAKS